MNLSELYQIHQKYFKTASPIHKNDIFDAVKIIANLVEIFPEILMDNLLGSAGKQEISGDIDIAIEDDIENIVDILERNRAIFRINKGLNCINLLIEMKNSQNVQVDLFFGETEWLKFSHFSAGDKSKYKGMYRTILLSSIISATTDFADFDANSNLIAKVGPVLNLSEGIKTQYRISPMKKQGIGYIKRMVEVSSNDQEFVHRYGAIKTKHININNPSSAAQFIFSTKRQQKNISVKDLETFEQVHKLMLERISLKKQKVIQTIFRNRTGKILSIIEDSNEIQKTINKINIQRTINKKYPELSAFRLSSPSLRDDRYIVNIDNISIERKDRDKGIGSKVMTELITWADQNNIWLTLQLASKKKNTLIKFYKRFGFVRIKGRNKDFSLSAYTEMYRKPKIKINEDTNIDILQNQIKKTYPQLSKFGLSKPRDAGYDRQAVNIAMIEIKSEYRKTGIGTLVMKDIISWADQNNIWLTLSVADKSKGGATSRSRLVKFYKRFGFIENKGRNKDYAISAEMYRKPKSKINEAQSMPMPWNSNPIIGWWLDNDKITFYHGTHKDKLESILQNGLKPAEKGRTAGINYLALDPYTSKGYGSMSGETEFRGVGKKAKHVRIAERVVIVFEFSKEYVEQNINWNNPQLNNKQAYEKFEGKDHSYYELSEVRHPGNISSEFIVGYMIPDK